MSTKPGQLHDFIRARGTFTDRATPAAWARLVAASRLLDATGRAERDAEGTTLPVNVANLLRRHGLMLEGVQGMSDAELLSRKGIGPLALHAIRTALPPRPGA